MKRRKVEDHPIYPHSEYVAKLYEAMAERRLSDAEARAALNSKIFESIIESWLPELRGIAATSQGFEEENAQLLIAQSATMAQVIALEIILAQRDAQRIQTAVDGDVERMIKLVKG